MEIVNLASRMQYVDCVVDWLYGEWGNHTGKGNRAYWESWVRSSLSRIGVPQTYVAIEDGELVATFSIWRCDLQSRQDLYPWFGGLFVREDCRNQGIGTAMQKKALDVFRELRFNKVYCFSEFSGYYEKLGWVFEEMIPDENGEMVRLYSHTID